MRLKELRKTLNDCHITSQDKHLDFFDTADTAYLLRRVEEELQGNPTDKSLILCIRLLNIARQKQKEVLKETSNAALHNEGER